MISATTTEVPRAQVAMGTFPYGWNGTQATQVVIEDGEERLSMLPFPQHYRRQFTHAARTILLGAPRYGLRWAQVTVEQAKSRRELLRVTGARQQRYIVWHDMSLRRADKVMRKQLEKMTPAEQTALVEEAARRAGGVA
jgi:GH18 family chitinase